MATSYFEQKAEVSALASAAFDAASSEREQRRSVVEHGQESKSRLKIVAIAAVAGIVFWSLRRKKREPETEVAKGNQRSLILQAGFALLTAQRWHYWLERIRQALRDDVQEANEDSEYARSEAG